MHRFARTAFVSPWLLAAGCSEPASQATPQASRTDTVVVNARGPTSLPSFQSARVWWPRASRPVWRRISGAPVPVNDSGVVVCDREGSIVVAMERGARTDTITVLCRPVAYVRTLSELHFRLGDAPRAYDIGARGSGGGIVRDLAGTATIADTSIAVLRDGMVHARAVGVTAMEVRVGDCLSVVMIDVEAPAATSTEVREYEPFETDVTLASGEVRGWPLRAGLQVVYVTGDSAILHTLDFAVLHANCATLRVGPRSLSCVMTDSSVVALGNARSRTAFRGRLRVERVNYQPMIGRARRSAPPVTSVGGLCTQYNGWERG